MAPRDESGCPLSSFSECFNDRVRRWAEGILRRIALIGTGSLKSPRNTEALAFFNLLSQSAGREKHRVAPRVLGKAISSTRLRFLRGYRLREGERKTRIGGPLMSREGRAKKSDRESSGKKIHVDSEARGEG